MSLTHDPIPRFTPEKASKATQRLYDKILKAKPLYSYSDQAFLMENGDQFRFILKIANAQICRKDLDLENRALEYLNEHADLPIQRLLKSYRHGEMPVIVNSQDQGHLVRLFTYLPGTLLSELQPSPELRFALGQAFAEFDKALQPFDHLGAHRFSEWDISRAPTARKHFHHIADPAQRALLHYFTDAFDREAAPILAGLRAQVIHGDGNPNNVLGSTKGAPTITGIFDFGDMVWSATVNELAIIATYAMMDQADPIGAGCDVVRGFHASLPLEEAELQILYYLIAARLVISVTNSAHAKTKDPDNAYISVDEQRAWALLQQLVGFEPAIVADRFRETCGYPALQQPRTVAEIVEARSLHLNPAQSTSYREPLKLTRGWRQYLYDQNGQAYLDCVNNVCHVGHAHPSVVRAAQTQMALLNTNTRYLHDLLPEYSRRLLATLPPQLSVVTLVCSGSEANDLAQRMARTHTGRRNIVVLESAYHGNTTTNIEISPYKYNHKGGPGRAAHIFPALLPDPFRGPYRGEDCGEAYANHVASALTDAAATGGAAAFIAESVLGCGGQVVLPDGYLQKSFEFARAAGAVCIADEVQVGFGRVGSHFWGFQTQGVVPDIVTLGKPIGNGHPMAAVITTPEIAASFNNGLEYFNTFGGNPVSCAIGLAVLDVIEQEQLQDQAARVGTLLRDALTQLKAKHPLIGDVRGLGLFIGIELVKDRTSLEPATEEANCVVNLMKDRHILLSSDGPYDNVLKIKPPIVFTEENALHLAAQLDEVFASLK